MEQPPVFKPLQDAIQAALIATTRTVGQISAEDLGFQRSFNREVGEALDEQNARLLGISSSILESAAALTESNAPILQEVDDVDNNWRGIVDVVDSLLERADTCLDEYTGVIKRKGPPVEQVCLADVF
jgi:exosome complex exonuclease RRP6